MSALDKWLSELFLHERQTNIMVVDDNMEDLYICETTKQLWDTSFTNSKWVRRKCNPKVRVYITTGDNRPAHLDFDGVFSMKNGNELYKRDIQFINRRIEKHNDLAKKDGSFERIVEYLNTKINIVIDGKPALYYYDLLGRKHYYTTPQTHLKEQGVNTVG